MSSEAPAGLARVRLELRSAAEVTAGRRRYTRGIALVAVLALLGSAVFVALTLIQGARLSSVGYDAENLVSGSGQRIVFSFNQVLDESAEIVVRSDPAVAATAQVSGRQVIVSTSEPLDYGTEYTLVLDGVTSTFSGTIHGAEVTFETPQAELIALVRGGDFTDASRGLDQLVVSPLTGGGQRVIFEDAAIQEFVLLGDLVVVATLNPDGSSALWLVDEASRQVEALPLPGTGQVSNLQTAPGNLLGFSYSALDGGGQEASIQFLDLSSTARTLVEATGVGGTPVRAVSWFFLGGTSNYLASATDTTLTLLDARDATVQVPLGQFSALYGVSRQGDRAVVGIAEEGRAILTLADRSTVPLTLPDEEGVQFFDGDRMLDGDDHLGKFIEFSAEGYATSVRRLVGEEWQTVYASESGRSIDAATLSENGQYLLLETSEGESGAPLDGYPVEARPVESLTLVLDAATGDVLKTMNGTDIRFRLGDTAGDV